MWSLRTRLALVFAALVAATSLLIGVTVYARVAEERDARTRRAAVDQAQAAAEVYAAEERLVLGAVTESRDVPAGLVAAVRGGDVASVPVAVEERAVVWAGARATATVSVFVRVDAQADALDLAALRRVLIGAGALASLVGAVLGVVLAGRLSGRLRRAAATAERVAAGELDVRIGAAGRDEVGVLAAAVDRMSASLGERIERERRFAADVAHELRTPVASLLVAVDLLDPALPHVETMRERVRSLARLIDDLLEISRLDRGVEEADLREVDVLALVRAAASDVADATVVAEAEQVVVRTDPRRLDRIVRNLLDNASRHGAPPIVVRVTADRIEVLDHGAGFPADLAGRATEPFTTGAAARGGGAGLGLAIAERHARLLAATLELGEAPGAGARVAVVFAS